MMLPRADRLEAQHALRGRRNHRADLGMMIFFVGIRTYFMLQLITILNRCYHFPGFVYQQARFSSDQKSIEIAVRPRKGSGAVCSVPVQLEMEKAFPH